MIHEWTRDGKAENSRVGTTLELNAPTWPIPDDDRCSWYAQVWDEETQRVISVPRISDNGYSVSPGTVDATPEVREKARRFYYQDRLEMLRGQDGYAAETVERRKIIKVVSGRKVPKGTTGTCIWKGEGRWGWRVGLKTDSGEVFWTALSNVRVVNPDLYRTQDSVLENRASEYAETRIGWIEDQIAA